MYILIFEDGKIAKKNDITDDEKQSVRDGFLDLIETDDDNPIQYFNGAWMEISEA